MLVVQTAARPRKRSSKKGRIGLAVAGGGPIGGAQVDAAGALAPGVSDPSGAYEIVLTLREGQAVTFEAGQGPKGPRAENVRPS